MTYTLRRPSFRTSPWYSLATAPLRFLTTPIWSEFYRRFTGVRMLNELPVGFWKIGNTAFILGSGPSINEMRKTQWKIIEHHTSVGFNWWLHHPFVPNLYVFENISPKHRELLRSRIGDYAATPLILKQFLSNFSPLRHRRRAELLKSLPHQIRSQIYMSSDFLLPGRTADEMRKSCRLMSRLGLLTVSERFQWLPKRTSSLLFLVALCVRAGFEEVVLCGVDLNRPGYFFDTPIDGHPMSANPRHQHPYLHETEDSGKKVLPISETLFAFSDEVMRPLGIKLYVGHRESALASSLPIYPWSDVDLPA